MNRKLFAPALIALMVMCLGCAKKSMDADIAKVEIPPAPAEGIYLAKAAERVSITNGPNTPVRTVLSQAPQQRPCWAIPEGKGCKMDRPGFTFFVGTSSGAATKEGAVLNAYQNAIEQMALSCLKSSVKPDPKLRESVRAQCYFAAGVHDKSYRLKEGQWVQKWQERYKDSMRVYYRAFVLLSISDKEFVGIRP